jgi:hypothetical protein
MALTTSYYVIVTTYQIDSLNDKLSQSMCLHHRPALGLYKLLIVTTCQIDFRNVVQFLIVTMYQINGRNYKLLIVTAYQIDCLNYKLLIVTKYVPT